MTTSTRCAHRTSPFLAPAALTCGPCRGDDAQYWTGKDAPEATKTKKLSADKGSLDDDLDSYFSKKAAPAAEE